MKEEWRDVAGYEGIYQVSNLGRIKSLDKRVRVKPPSGWTTRVIHGRMLSLGRGKDGYLRVGLSGPGGCKGALVHRLVAEAFIPNPKRKKQVDHINGIRDDNRVENLRWATPKENELWKVERLRGTRGDVIYNRAPNQCHRVKCLETGEAFISVAAAARAVGAQAPNIAAVCLKYPYCHTAGGYHWEYID